MKKSIRNRISISLYLLFIMDILIIVSVTSTHIFSKFDDPDYWPEKSVLFYGSLGMIGIISAIIGALLTLRYIRGIKSQPIFVSIGLVLSGLVMIAICMLAVMILNSCWGYNQCP